MRHLLVHGIRSNSLVTFLELRIRHILPFLLGSHGVVGVTVSDQDDALHLRGDGRFVDLSADAHSPDERELLSSWFSLLGAFNEEFLQVCRCEDSGVRNGLARIALVDDGAFPDGRGELRLGHLHGHPRVRGTQCRV